jgi:hypothetical protein
MNSSSLKITRSISFKTILFLSVLAAAATSCKKGDTGPAGTANVLYSDWFTPASWVKDTVFNVYGFNYTQSASEITQNVIDSGTVIVFGKLLGYNTAIWPTTQTGQLPIILNYKFSAGGITYTDTWSSTIVPGKVKVRFVDDQNYYGSIATAHQFRYIIIPGGKHIPSATAVSPAARTGQSTSLNAATLDVVANYSHMSYEEVCDKLKIPM